MSDDEKPRRVVAEAGVAKAVGAAHGAEPKRRVRREFVTVVEVEESALLPQGAPVPPRRGRPLGRVVSLGRIARAYHELAMADPDKEPSQADVARRLKEAQRNVERTLSDEPDFWRELTGRA